MRPERADVASRLLLFGGPLVVAVVITATQTVVPNSDVVLAASALLVGALLAGFTQVAAWRERVWARTDGKTSVRVRALNEAGALILSSIPVTVVAALAVFVVTLTPVPHEANLWRWLLIAVGSVGPAALAYVALSLLFVTNLLWDAFVSDETDVKRENLAKF